MPLPTSGSYCEYSNMYNLDYALAHIYIRPTCDKKSWWETASMTWWFVIRPVGNKSQKVTDKKQN